MGKIIKKAFKVLKWMFLTSLIMLIVFFVLIQQASVQTRLARKAAAYLSRELSTQVYIEKLKVAFPLNIDIKNLGIEDRHGKPVLRTEGLQFSLGSLRFKAHNMKINRISLKNPEINLITYEGDSVMSFQFVLDYFSGTDTTDGTATPWAFRLMNAEINNATFSLHDYNTEPQAYGIDFNHLNLSNIYLTMSELSFANDSLLAHIHHLSANDQSGFVLNRLRTEFLLTPEGIFANDLIIQTPNSELLMNLAFLFEDFSAFSHFTSNIYMQAFILPSEFNMADLAYFAPELQGMDNRIAFEGQVSGEVKSLNIRNFALNFGSYTRFKGNISLDGLPNIKETFMHINARELSTHYMDLMKIKLPSANGTTRLNLPEEIRQLGHLRVNGRFTGFYYDFVSDGTFRTNQGSVTTDIMLKFNEETKQLDYAGALKTRRFNIGRLIGQEEWIGRLNMNARVDGKGRLPSSFDVKFTANLDSIEFKGNVLNSLNINGELADKRFNGSLKLQDELINLDFLGLFDLNNDPPVFNFTAELENAFVAGLNLLDRDSTADLSAKLEFNFKGDNLDNLEGGILINDLKFHEAGYDYLMTRFALNAHPISNGNRKLSLRSDYIDADFDGHFNYSEIYPAFRKVLRIYLPSAAEDKITADAEVPAQSFTSLIILKNSQPLSRLFFPEIVINKNARIETSFDSEAGIAGISANSAGMTVFGTKLKDWQFSLSARNEKLYLKTTANQLLVKETTEDNPLEVGFEKLKIDAAFAGDTINYGISWSDYEMPLQNSGSVAGFLSFANSPVLELRIAESELSINKSPWKFNSENLIALDSSAITISNLIFEGTGQSIRVNGKITSDPVERLSVSFEQWDLENLDLLLKNYGIDASGILSGNIDLLDLYQSPGILAGMTVANFTFNNEKLGDLHLTSSWDTHTQSLWVDTQIKYTGNVGTITPFSLQGFYYPQKEADSLDFNLELFNFKLGIFEPFLTGILSDIKGLASGNVRAQGCLSALDISGQLSLMRTEFKVDFTNTHYSLADVVNIEKNKIWVNNLNIFDEFGNSGVASLQFTHNNFADWYMDLRVQANNLAGLQTTASDNSMFYGTAFITGTFSLGGAFNDLNMDIKARSGPQTYIAIPITFAVDVSDNDFITFISPEAEITEMVVEDRDPSSFRVNLETDITRDAVVQIFLPYQMGNIRSSGSGNIKMQYNTTGDFTMYGDYVTEQGSFLFTLQNMINRSFTLLPGGTIRWSGSPYDAFMNIQAVYKTRVTLNSLPNISDEFRNRRFPVDCVVTLKNSLTNPEISFGIRMPNVDEQIQRQVFSAVDTTNEVIMSRQMISLLVLNSFNFSTDQTNLASTLGASSFDFLSNQLNSWLSQISKDFDIGINYRPGDQLSAEELEVALSTQLFDDRVIIDGNLGMLGEHSSQQNASNIIGDINVEVKVTRDGRFRVRAFNKYNNQEITRREAPYSQGVGIFYRREFDRFSDLWQPRQKVIIEPYYPNGNNGNGNLQTPLNPPQP